MNTDYRTIACVDGGWFGTVAYTVDLVAVVLLLYLLIRNVVALSSGGGTPASEAGIGFRLLLSKRVTQILGLFCGFQICNFLAFALFFLATLDSRGNAVVVALTYSYRPIGFTFGVLALGMVQYAVLDAALKRKAMRRDLK